MIEFETLTTQDYEQYCGDMALFDKVVLEDLYYYLYDRGAPHNYYNASNLVSPRNKESHSYYFPRVKKVAVELYCQWYNKLVDVFAEDERDIASLKRIGQNIEHSHNMVELLWYSTFLQKVVYQYRAIMRETQRLART